ncbi:hypothetical protein PHMEG_00023135 [Phytophthora megakarya]|uniref:BZIP domain-containing protein n=1 Tax=Phytophthora megakarya TaxID=4795 RepID=A0A225VJF7_9STRA|nr:hypothetical protein PHMEG_00023135 [Phytophthora megakarya]
MDHLQIEHFTTAKLASNTNKSPVDDAELSLNEMLSYIDSFSIYNAATEIANNREKQRTTQITELPRQKKQPRKRSESARRRKQKADAARCCYVKKRTELLTLRGDVKKLERYLAELNRGLHCFPRQHTTLKRDSTSWCNQARVERQLRQQAETQNLQLKAILARQSQFAESTCFRMQNVAAMAVGYSCCKLVWFRNFSHIAS